MPLKKFDINFRAGDAFKAETYINQLAKLGCRVDDTTVASLISLYGKKRKLIKALEIFTAFADSPSAKKLLCNSMLDAYAKCGKPQEAYALYKQLTEEGHNLDAVAISIVVNALTNSGTNLEGFVSLAKIIDYQMIEQPSLYIIYHFDYLIRNSIFH